MNIEEFKNLLKEYDEDTNEYGWKEKMMMVTKLYRAMGKSEKDVNEKSLDDIKNLINGIINSTADIKLDDIYSYMELEKRCEDLKKTGGRLTDEQIRENFFGNPNGYDDNMFDHEHHMQYTFQMFGLVTLEQLKVKSPVFDDFWNNEMLNNMKSENSLNVVIDKEKVYESAYKFIISNPSVRAVYEKLNLNEHIEAVKTVKATLKEGLIDRLISINNILGACGYLDAVVNVNNGMMEKFDIPLKVTVDESNKEDFCIFNLVDKEYYKQFDIEELNLLSAFYTNRFEKIIDNIQEGMYLHSKLGTFYDSVAYNEINSKFDDRDAKVILRQRAFLEKVARKNLKEYISEMKKHEKNLDSKSYIEKASSMLTTNLSLEDAIDKGLDSFSNATTEHFKQIEEKNYSCPKNFFDKFKKVYREYFGRYINENDIEKDYAEIWKETVTSQNIYTIKVYSMESLLYALANSKTKINYGKIKESRIIKNRAGEEMTLIGVDFKEFPSIRLHVPKAICDEFEKKFLNGEKIQPYKGNEDFQIGLTQITTQLLYKFTKKQKQAIKKKYDELKKSASNSQVFAFIRHMYENIHPSKKEEHEV